MKDEESIKKILENVSARSLYFEIKDIKDRLRILENSKADSKDIEELKELLIKHKKVKQ